MQAYLQKHDFLIKISGFKSSQCSESFVRLLVHCISTFPAMISSPVLHVTNKYTSSELLTCKLDTNHFFSRVLDTKNSTYTTACHIFPYSILISWPIKCHGLALFLFGASSSMDWTQSKTPKSCHMLGGLCEGRSGFCFVFFIKILQAKIQFTDVRFFRDLIYMGHSVQWLLTISIYR